MNGIVDQEARAARILRDEVIRERITAESKPTVMPLFLENRGIKLDGEEGSAYEAQPWHRMAAQLAAFGYNNKQIAAELGKSVQTVGTLIKRREFQAVVTAIIEENGGQNDLMGQLKNEVAASLQTLVEIRDDEKAPKAVRANIAFGILERYLGKVPQKLEHSGEIKHGDPVQAVEQLKRANIELQREVGPSVN